MRKNVKLTHLRNDVLGLTREEFAKEIGISKDYIVGLETGRNYNPTIKVLEAIRQVVWNRTGIDYNPMQLFTLKPSSVKKMPVNTAKVFGKR